MMNSTPFVDSADSSYQTSRKRLHEKHILFTPGGRSSKNTEVGG
jgi:hypothetical protein